MYVYTVNHIPILKGKRPGIKTKMTSITIHNTGNPDSTALNERNWLGSIHNIRAASFHVAIDGEDAIECIPLNEVAYHSGNATGNLSSIGIEICESGNYNANEQNAVDLIAKMLVERGWGIDKLKRHYDWNGKNCPHIIIPYWNWFKEQIQIEMNKLRGECMRSVLSLGSKGEVVKELQRKLETLGYGVGTYGADGDFGAATDKAVRLFQRDYNLIGDGIVGEATWDKLDTLLASMGQPVTGDTDKYKNTLIMIRNSINEVLGE